MDKLCCSFPVLSDGIVYIGSLDHKIYALNAADGKEIWSFTTDDNIVSTPTVADGLVYVGSLDDKVYALT